jgi:DNA-binding MarR family transcriptional regulator
MLTGTLFVVKILIMTVPAIGEAYRGVDGRSGFLVRQAWHELRSAMDVVLRPHGLSAAQYGVMSVLSRDPGVSGAELARASNISPQAMNELLGALERDGLVKRRPHPTHGRILQVNLTEEGRHQLDAARPDVDRLEKLIDKGYTKEQIALVRAWLVTAAQRMVEEATSLPDS